MTDTKPDVARDDDCEEQALMHTDTCLIFGCDNTKLVRHGRDWRCPHCKSSYGEFARAQSEKL